MWPPYFHRLCTVPSKNTSIAKVTKAPRKNTKATVQSKDTSIAEVTKAPRKNTKGCLYIADLLHN